MDELARLYRRLMMLVGRGRLTAGNDAGPVQTQQVKLGADEVRDTTPRLAEFGFASMPPAGSDAVVVFLGGDRSNGCIVATGHQASRLRNLLAGEAAIYSDLGQKVHLERGKITVDGGGLPVEVVNASTITATATEKIRLEAPEIEIHATTSFRFDVDGHGQHWFPTKVDTWQTGETAGTAHPITPPEIS